MPLRAARDASALRGARWPRSRRPRASPREPLLEPMRMALAARCTVGEVCGALRGEWGSYDAQMSDGR